MPIEFWVVDRFEGDRAVLIGDDESERIVPSTDLPPDAREGSVLRPRAVGEPATGAWIVDHEEAERRLRDASDILDDLRQRDPGGDIEL